MQSSGYAVGQAVFLRTDTPDYAEESIPFRNLEELVRLCSTSQPNLTLDKIIVYSMIGDEPRAVTLGFVSATRGQRPSELELAH